MAVVLKGFVFFLHRFGVGCFGNILPQYANFVIISKQLSQLITATKAVPEDIETISGCMNKK